MNLRPAGGGPMSTLSTHVDVEEIQTTKSEKLLALVLAGFLLVGGLWSYQGGRRGPRACRAKSREA